MQIRIASICKKFRIGYADSTKGAHMTLKEYRNWKQLTQHQVAKALGVWPGTISRWETGAKMPRRDDLQRIAEFTGGKVTANDFV